MKRLTFDLIDKCNLACVSCYHGINGGTGRMISLKTCKEIIDHSIEYLSPTHLFPYNWSEPFLYEQLSDTLDLFDSYKDLTITLSSNMNLAISNELIKKILRTADVMKFSVSSLNQKIYQKYHRGGKLSRVLKNINKFVSAQNMYNSSTKLVWTFGRNLKNRGCEKRIKKYCASKNIIFSPTRYYVTDIKDVFKIYKNEIVDDKVYNVLHHSYGELRREVLKNLTPHHCPLIDYDIVTDTDGFVMTCCATKIILDTHITEIKDIKHLVEVRLKNEFCRMCHETGLIGYFRLRILK